MVSSLLRESGPWGGLLLGGTTEGKPTEVKQRQVVWGGLG